MTTKTIQMKKKLRLKRKLRIRGQISGTQERPRISIFKSNKFLYAQAIDDVAGNTLAAINGKKEGLGCTKEDASKLGALYAQKLKAKGINHAVFDRNGYLYHGVVAAFADALRSNGITI